MRIEFINIQILMNQTLIEKLGKYKQWIEDFEFDAMYGYLINPNYHPVSFDYEELHSILINLPALNESKSIIEVVKAMKPIQINRQLGPPHKDMLILHDLCSYLVHSYVKAVREFGVEEQDVVVPESLASALAFSASFLRVKIGMATGISYNWQFKEKPQNLDNLTVDNIKIRHIYSTQPEHESLFFQVSVVTSYFLSQIIKNCYEINCIIVEQPNLEEEVQSRMKKIKGYLEKIRQTNINIQLKLDREFFYNVLRVFVAGFQHVQFEGINQRISSSGGAGGYDPSFQTFERAFGIHFHGQLGTIQEKLRNGMPHPHRGLVDFMAENSLIREYCECSPELQIMYNDTLSAYIRYLELHGTFIKNFIIRFMPINTPKSTFGGTGATMIKIIDRYLFVKEQEL